MIEQGAFTINGIQDIAVTTIQKCWRGYQVRKGFKGWKDLLMEHNEKVKGKKRASAVEQRRTWDLPGNQSPRSVSPRYLLFNPLTPNIKEQILLSCPHTFLVKLLGRSYKDIKKIHLR